MTANSPIAVKTLLILSFWASAIFSTTSTSASESVQSWNEFEFRNGFYTNLHLFLFELARRPGKLKQVNWTSPLSENEKRTLDMAISHYQTNFIEKKRSAHIDSELNKVKQLIGGLNSTADLNAIELPLPLIAIWKMLKPLYENKLWRHHQQSNQQWIDHVTEMLGLYGELVEKRLRQFFEADLSPKGPIFVDVSYEVGVFAGAYTTTDPAYIVITSVQSKYQGYAALEMLFHEASHAYATEKLDLIVERALKKRNIESKHRRLWHFIQFLAVGWIVESVLAENQIVYQMYFLKAGVVNKSHYKNMVEPTLKILCLSANKEKLKTKINKVIAQFN